VTAVWPQLAPWQWLVGVGCAVGVGLAKTGVPGMGIFVVPLMVLTVGDARQSAGWLLPLLCVADVFAVVAWRRHAETRRLFSLVPWVLVGMIAGALALGGPEALVRRLVGAIVLLMVILRVVRGQGGAAVAGASGDPPPEAPRPSVLQPAAYGIAAGLATTVANAAGPVMNLYLLSRRLPKEQFIATGAWFFLVINLSKLPLYAHYGLIHGRSLLFDLVLVPPVLAGAAVGRRLATRIPQRAFERLVLVLTAAAAGLLLLR
jgi:uncharacterized membrane protein YfcA